jgi:glycosyltransferase involved in cell wall biosynthesis
LGDVVHFTGAVAEPVPYIREFTVGVLPSDSEGLSNAILEYMACGVPVVCTNVGGNPEIVRDGESGLLVAARDPAGLADRICRVLENADLAARLSTKGRQVVNGLSVERMVEAHSALYARLAAAGC